MRILCLLLCFPLLACAQNQQQNPEKANNFWQRGQLRLGVLLQQDTRPLEVYEFKAADLLPNFQRKGLPSLVVDWQPFFRTPFLRSQVRVGYSSFDFIGEPKDLPDNRYGPDFREEINYRSVQLAAGIQLEASQLNRVTPYLAGHFLLSVPTRLAYEVSRTYSIPTITTPRRAEVKGGAKMSPGWEISSGFRSLIGDHWTMLLGAYYTEHEVEMDWPDLETREFSGTLMRSKGLGFFVAWQYRW